MKKRYRIQPSEKAGYGPGQFVVQKYDKAIGRWFDVGDPLTDELAKARMAELTSKEEDS